ncbi:MAG: AMP-binding protein [Anaerolineales bacterium]|nr:AMP-binding protein [Anaerolineales bacterium]
MSQPQTLPQHFLDKVKHYPADKVALRQKELGIWREFTWQDSYEKVKQFCLGMIALGLQRGDHVCYIGDNERQALWGYIGVQAAGGAMIGLYTDSRPQEIEYIVNHSDAAFVLAKDQEQCDKFLEIREQIPKVKKVIYWDERGLWDYEDDLLMQFEDVLELGRELAAKEPDRFETEVAIGRADDLAMLCYTSGTTGLPKGVMLSHSNLMYSAKAYAEIDARYDSDNHLSFLPMGWIAEPVLGFASHTATGVIINFPEEPETVRENMREISPETVVYNSRLWDGIVATIQVRMQDATWLNRRLYETFLPIGYQVADKKFKRESVGAGLKLAYQLGDRLVFRPLRGQLGLANIRSAYTGGAALSPDAMRYLHALGINIKQIYGSTEVTGGATLHRDDDIKFASVGQPAPGIDAKISAEGEILLAGPTVMQGYYKNPEATAKDILEEDGVRWFKTGDAGHIDDDGHIIFMDRVKNIITLSNGERFSPQFIEGRLKFSPYIRDVMSVGGETRDFVTALIIIDFETVGQWAEKNGIGYTTFVDLSQKPEVYDLVLQAVKDVNASMPEGAQVKRFVLLHKEFDADEAEMTRTRKLRRNVLVEKYGDIIEAMYVGQESVKVRATVTYQDGREGIIETTIRVMSI